MDSDRSDEDEHHAISKQIVDYYKKYSQSKQLPKYFSGTSLSYMPKIVKEDEIASVPIIVIDDSKCGEDAKVVSPASSVASNRKLEWDNGADIGYGNCREKKLQKSHSLPTLIGTSDFKVKAPKTLSTQIVTVISYSSQSDDKPLLTSSSSSSYPNEAPEMIKSSSSSGKIDNKPTYSSSSSSLANTLAYLKSKIGSPDANSTPKLSFPNKNFVRLCITEPVVIECIGAKTRKRVEKNIQTTLVEKVSKYVQTCEIDNEPLNPVINNQSIIEINYHSGDTSVNTQTDTEQCYQHDNVSNISKKHSKSLIGDIDKSIEILQKLLKSKKYDQATKKKYIKKIVEKIVDNKYSGDSTTSSELFVPKKQEKLVVKTFNDEYLPKKSIFTTNQVSLESSSESYQSWKTDKTLSEKLLEEKQKGQGDQIVQFAQKERQNQIAWIDDEISHLTKLRGMLETNAHRTTTVYMLSQQFDKRRSTSSANSQRNYVIETNISPSTSAASAASERMVGDIEYVSNEQMTNIKVTARKMSREKSEEIFKPKEPKLVGVGKYDTFPRSRAEEERCWPCGMIQSRISAVGGGSSQQHYSFDVPLGEHSSSFIRKVDEILSKYNLKSGMSRCICCKCGKSSTTATDTNIRTSTSSSTSSHASTHKTISKNEAKSTSCVCCKCAETQTKRGKTDITQTNEGKTDTIQTNEEEIIKNVHCICCKCSQVSQINEGKKTVINVSSVCCKCADTQTKANEGKSDESVHCVCDKCADTQRNVGKTNKNVNCVCCKCVETQINEGKITAKSVHCLCDKCAETNTKTNRGEITVAGVDCVCDKCVETQRNEGKIDKNVHCVCDKCTETQTNGGSNINCICCKCAETQTNEGTTDKNVHCGSDNCAETQTNKGKSDKNVNCICCKCAETQTNEETTDKNITCICCKCAEIQTDAEKCVPCNKMQSSSCSCSSASSASSSCTCDSSSATLRSCICCKKRNVTSKALSALRKQLSDKAYPLCRPCFRQNQRCSYSFNMYSNPTHICTCYTLVETKTLDEIKKTITDLDCLDQYCTCLGANDCKFCKLRRTSKNKGGIAYMLTFENVSPKEVKRKKPQLQEIKIKIPTIRNKKHKNKANRKKKESRSQTESDDALEAYKAATLEEYLKMNRPSFVETAEGRRHTVVHSRMQREELADQNKLLFLQNYLNNKNNEPCAKRLFSEKEMKEITRKNYRKLPEVQRKLIDGRERQMRQANRLMADTFNRKLRENVLKGKSTLPTDINVVNL